MKTPTLIGLAGGAGSGKDSVGEILTQRYDFARFSFAGPLKDMLLVGFALTRAHFDDPTLKNAIVPHLGVSPRRLAQAIGTEGARAAHPDIWLRVMARRLEPVLRTSLGRRIVITDVRFDNEAGWIRSQGGTIWHLYRPGSGLKGEAGAHASEAGVPVHLGDVTLSNHGTLAELEHIVHRAIARHSDDEAAA